MHLALPSILTGILALGALVPGAVVSAHATGATHEVEAEGYFIDIGYTPEFPTTDRNVQFDFSAYRADDRSADDVFTDVWVRITHIATDEVVFSGNLFKPDIGPTGFGLRLSEPGEYRVYTRFQKDFSGVVDTEFTMEVMEAAASEPERSSIHAYLYGLALFGVVVIGLGLLLWWRRRAGGWS